MKVVFEELKADVILSLMVIFRMIHQNSFLFRKIDAGYDVVLGRI